MSQYAIVNGIILDGTQDMVPQKGKIIFIKNERIEAVREASADTAGYEVIDLNGQYIMPGLINLHVHIPANGKPKKKQTDARKLAKLLSANALTKWIGYQLCRAYVKPELLSGVTTIRTVGGLLDIDGRLRDSIAAGKTTGPRIIAGNMGISVPGGGIWRVLWPMKRTVPGKPVHW